MGRKVGVVACIFAVSLSAVAARGDNTPDPCSDTSCPVICGSATAPCVVLFKKSKSSHTPVVSIKGTPAPQFCVADGTKVKWIVPGTAKSIYAVTFNPKHTPFSQSLFVGDGLHPFSDTATNHGGTDRCYVYSFVICSGGKCQHADPRVVVGGGP